MKKNLIGKTTATKKRKKYETFKQLSKTNFQTR